MLMKNLSDKETFGERRGWKEMLGRGILITGNRVSAFEDQRLWRDWNEMSLGQEQQWMCRALQGVMRT